MSAAFSDRYLFAKYDDGGVVVDLTSGNYYRVNRTAIVVCEALHDEDDRVRAEARVAHTLSLTASAGARAVGEVIAALEKPRFQGEIQGSYHFYPTDEGYELRHGKDPVLDVARDGSRIAVAAGAPAIPADRLELYVRAVLPKLLTRCGVTILHAAACSIDQHLIAFSGVSGAGKTTTARAFAEAGAKLISEEWLVFAPGGLPGQVLTEAEASMNEWARRTAVQLQRDRACSISAPGFLGDLGVGPTIPLERILFLDSNRRAGDDFQVRSLEHPDALAELLRHDFLGAIDTDSWRHFFDAAVALLAQIEARQAWAPDGMEKLKEAAARYASTMAS